MQQTMTYRHRDRPSCLEAAMTRTRTATRAVAICLAVLASAAAPRTAGMEAARASLRGDGTLVLNGDPIFPIGIRIEGEGREHARIAEAGFNTLLTSGDVGPAFFDAAARQGLHVIAGHYAWATFRGVKRDQVDLYASSLKQAFRLRNMSGQTPLEALAAAGRYPCIFAWNTCEEPHARIVEPLAVLYEIIKSHSPHHLVIGLSDDASSSHIFQNAADVVMVDCYPYRGRLSQPAMLIFDRVREVGERTGGKPVWFMPQLYPPSYFSKDPADDLTLGIMREACYLGLVAGAKGIVMYSYYALGPLDTDAGRRRWDVVRQVVGELRELAAVLCDGRPGRLPLSWLSSSGTSVPAPPLRVLEHYGSLYLLAANPSNQPLRAPLTAGLIRQRGYAFDARVLAGNDGLTVNSATTDGNEHPELGVAPHGCGVFRLQRRAMAPP